MSARTSSPLVDRRPLVTAGSILGIGLGGFVDGIVFHQILQLHSMLSALYPQTSVVNIEYSMIWDGLFHVFTWLMTVIGISLVWRAARFSVEPWANSTLLGASILGWGLFNTVEGLVDHFLLQIHHVVERQGLSMWDWAFLGSGVAFLILGTAIIRSAANRAPNRASARTA